MTEDTIINLLINSGLGAWLLGKVIKDSVDKESTRKDIQALQQFKAEIEEQELLTIPMHDKERDRCRTEVFFHLERISKSLEESVLKIERKLDRDDQSIKDIKETLVRVLTILEKK